MFDFGKANLRLAPWVVALALFFVGGAAFASESPSDGLPKQPAVVLAVGGEVGAAAFFIHYGIQYASADFFLARVWFGDYGSATASVGITRCCPDQWAADPTVDLVARIPGRSGSQHALVAGVRALSIVPFHDDSAGPWFMGILGWEYVSPSWQIRVTAITGAVIDMVPLHALPNYHFEPSLGLAASMTWTVFQR